MTAASVIDGKAIAAQVRADLIPDVTALRDAGIITTLAVVLAGDDPASQVYVRNKVRACEEVGIASRRVLLPSATTTAELLHVIAELNADATVHGILVQLPLPRGVDTDTVIDAIAPEKDVDGFHPENVGRLMAGRPRFVSCTPAGVMRLLAETRVVLSGATAVVLGRSRTVGQPVAALLTAADATVTVCHSRTRDLGAVTRTADVLVAAVGRPGLVKADMVKPGAVVIDVGINRLESGALVGDVDYAGVSAVASAITPVPGGVGPMTIAMLLQNTILAAKARLSSRGDRGAPQ
ncbi:MAG: bifunctional methylenetetrahydrofolate dehydrogenase/methenyltetrahydrofolate cyclohydrolase FolD [Myxococcales bacterium]|nr:bifunctional methylenetetrahydrofolate dehydrogenase/methenyltetrahydrofolate cyclohydrolase FolD [Myxococcales bacterium]